MAHLHENTPEAWEQRKNTIHIGPGARHTRKQTGFFQVVFLLTWIGHFNQRLKSTRNAEMGICWKKYNVTKIETSRTKKEERGRYRNRNVNTLRTWWAWEWAWESHFLDCFVFLTRTARLPESNLYAGNEALRDKSTGAKMVFYFKLVPYKQLISRCGITTWSR